MTRHVHTAGIAGAFAALCLSLAGPTHAEADAPPPVRDVRPGVYVGISSCANGFCHGAIEPQGDTAVLQNEYPTWMLGPHRKSVRTLSSDLSRQIVEALEGPGAKAEETKVCLDCHTLNVPASRSDDLFPEDGISCEACHGPAGGWRDRHFEEGWTYRQSLDAGMKDLRDAARRGEVCLSCHLGDEETRVDHRLIAAGHPRLFFELDNATGAIPRHWKLDAERPQRKASHGARAWATGQVVAFREGLEQLVSRPAGDGAWPEFSDYNCQSCHHSLAGARWRRQPGYRFQGGLPSWSTARYAVIRHLVETFAAAELERFDDAVEDLARQMTRMRRTDAAARAEELAGLAVVLSERLARVRWTKDDVDGMMRRLAADRARFVADIAAAEQLAFAFQSLMSRRVELDRRELRRPLVARIDAVFAELDDPDAFDRESFARRVAEVEEAFD